MNHRERITACISGKKTDRTPIAFWRHFPVDDQNPASLASATLAFQETYDMDIIKVTPASSFCVRDHGVVDRWQGSTEGTREYVERIIDSPQDWRKIKRIHPRKGSLGNQLECLKLIMKGNNDLIPTIQTIFSPLAQAKNLAGQERLINHIRKYPEEVTHGLATLTVITIDFISEISKLGVDGIFLAVQFGQSQLLSHEEFLRFETPYSLQVLDNARGFWLNMLHLHGDNVYFDSVIDWPVQIINWHDKHTPPSLQEGLRHFPGSVCGGLRRWETMVLGTPASVTDEVNEALDASKGTRTIIGSGCVLPIVTPSTNIFAARQAVATYSL